MAKKIQADQLPSDFPAFPDRKDFDIYAAMIPAKQVGGDFYDFFFVDDDHLALVIADVSGKGVPAALFMMMSKNLIRNLTMMGLPPKEVIERANQTICANNKQKMFVTIWLGILEISTGKVSAVNAGHEIPIINQSGGEFALFEEPHGLMAGLRVLVASLQTLDAHGGTMTLKNVSDDNMKVFKLTGLNSVFDIR